MTFAIPRALRNPFVIFMLVIALLTAGTLWFIQSPGFARFFKSTVYRLLPRDLGVDADFSEFAVRLYPPGLSLKDPKIHLRESKLLDLPPGSSIEAERIDLVFRPLQMLSGNIRVNDVGIVKGIARIKLNPVTAPQTPAQLNEARKRKSTASWKEFLKKGPGFRWDELFKIHAEALSLQDTRVRLEWGGERESVEFLARSLRLAQWDGQGGVGYEVSAELNEISGGILQDIPGASAVRMIKASARVNALGATIETLSLSGEGLDANVSCEVRGNFLAPKGLLPLTANVELGVDLGRLKGHLNGELARTLSEAEGRLTFAGKVQGELDRLLETLLLQGRLQGQGLRLGAWVAESFETQGRWEAQGLKEGRYGDLTLERTLLSAPEVPRAGGREAGSGGRVEAGLVKVRLGSADPIAVPLKLERAHLHWLTAPWAQDVFPLDFRASGPVELVIAPPAGGKGFEVRAKLDVKLPLFQLDNQRLEKNRPLTKIFEIPQLGINGNLVVNSTAVRVQSAELALPGTTLRLGGKVDYKTGFDLQAEGTADLKDLGHIAENEIRGQGSVKVRVAGPMKSARVDVDLDLQQAMYLRLNLGHVVGRVSWDDAPSHLLLSGLQATQGQTFYNANGKVDLGQNESIDLEIQIPKAENADFVQVFEQMTRDLWWFPRSLTGSGAGKAKVSGGLDLKDLKVDVMLSGADWQYFDERFEQVQLIGGFDRGKFHLASLSAMKGQGRILGRISFDAEERFDWDLRTENLLVSNLDHFARLDVPVRGRLSVESAGRGRAEVLQSLSRIHVTDLAIRGQAMPPSELIMKTAGGILEAQGSAMGSQGTLDLVYNFNPGARSYLRMDLSKLDFSSVLLLLNPKLTSDPSLAAHASGALQLTFNAGEFERASGEVQMNEFQMAKNGSRVGLARPVAFKVLDGSFDLNGLALKAGNSEARLELKSRQAVIDGRVSGEMDCSLVEFFAQPVSRAAGAAELDLILSGRLREPVIEGRAELKGASVWVSALDSPFENATGTLALRQGQVLVQNVQADLAGGRFSAEGTIDLYASRYPKLDLRGRLAGPRIRVFPFQFMKVRGDVTVKGEQRPYSVEGNLSVDAALSREKVFQQKQAQGLKAVQYTPPPSARRASDYPWFRLKIDANAPGGILVQNDLFDVDLRGKVSVVNTPEAPRILGAAELVSGRMIFKDRVFQIDSASAIFDNPAVINPKFNLTARTEVNGIKVQLYASGSMDKMKIDLNSTPVMPESEILSLLALGVTASDTKRLGSADRTVYEQGEAASLLLHSLDFNREVESKTGFQIQLDESVNSQVGTSVLRSSTQGQATSAPKIVVRRQILKNIDLSYGSTVGVGNASQKEVNAEVKLAPGISVIGVWDSTQIQGTTTNAPGEQNSTSSYGLDLKFQKRFR